VNVKGKIPKYTGFRKTWKHTVTGALGGIYQGDRRWYLHTSDLNEWAVRLFERISFERAFEYDRLENGILAKCYRFQLDET